MVGQGVFVGHSPPSGGKVSCLIWFGLPATRRRSPRPRSQPRVEVGEHVEVLYNPRNPHHAVLADQVPSNTRSVTDVLIVLGVAFVVAGCIRVWLAVRA
ncbi:DUF3592 domain-containing protein [Streptomyces sp. Tue6028]|uniref:DUF3592 domain-containing protein n=1 Tax=Streptomyces sp. Tue6028 TaxID=2036037 RepID=UPI003D73017F